MSKTKGKSQEASAEFDMTRDDAFAYWGMVHLWDAKKKFAASFCLPEFRKFFGTLGLRKGQSCKVRVTFERID